MLLSEWSLLEEDFGLNFIEVLDTSESKLMNEPLLWKDMVEVMGKSGLRGPDAMIVNLYDKSKFQPLITCDSDFESCFDEKAPENTVKAIYIL